MQRGFARMIAAVVTTEVGELGRTESEWQRRQYRGILKRGCRSRIARNGLRPCI
jgi:hypothetical protein